MLQWWASLGMRALDRESGGPGASLGSHCEPRGRSPSLARAHLLASDMGQLPTIITTVVSF